MSKLISRLIKTTISCIFVLLTLSLFITCDDPNNPFANPFSNNLGPKVVVEQPVIFVTSPDNNAFLKKDDSGNVTITGVAKAYIKVDRVEWRVLANQMFEQPETGWEGGINRGAGATTKEWPSWTLTFNPGRFNNGRDGYITMQFRAFDSGDVSKESIPYMFKIKTKPSEINMTNPNAEIILQDEAGDLLNPAKPSEISWKGTINGQVIDVKGLRPGYPQIKLWPADDPLYPDGTEPPDNDSQWGWATLFLPGKGAPGAGEDSIEKDMGDYFGDYADRSQMRVVNTANFSLLLAEYDIYEPTGPGDPLYNPDFPVRLIRYRKTGPGGDFIYFEAGRLFNFRIRTSDTDPNPVGEKPTANPDPLNGFFPPENFGSLDEDPFNPRTDGFGNIKPIKIQIKSSDSRTTIKINNYDKNGATVASITNGADTGTITIPIKNPDGSAVLNDPKLKPNIFITDASSRKIDRGAGKDLFRLRLQVNQANGIQDATLTWQHDNTMRPPSTLAWDNPNGWLYPEQGFNNPFDVNGDPVSLNPSTGDVISGKPDGKIFTFTAKAGNQGGYHFYSHTEPYVLTFTVTAKDKTQTVAYYTVYIDGDYPNVSIRPIRGAAKDPTAGPVDFTTPALVGAPGLVNADPYTVNGNIQVIVDRTDPSSPIMTWKPGMGADPPETDGYPMVKWIIEPATSAALEPTSGIIAKLNAYKNNPTPASLKFFNDIARARPPTSPELTGALASDWVMRPVMDSANEADRTHNFKFNTLNVTDKNYYWLYVIAQDQAQNLGFIVQKIYVDQNSDKPTVSWTNMVPYDSVTPVINLPAELEVKVEQATLTPPSDLTLSGNTSRQNVLLDNKDIELNLFDDDGIALSGITITLTDLNVSPNTVKTIPLDINFLKGGKKTRTYTLKQNKMAELLYGAGTTETKLRDGLYKLDVFVTDDIDQKVKIEQPQYPGMDTGDTPTTADSGIITYYFAVYTLGPPKVVIEYPKPGTMGSGQPMTISGTVTSRLSVQNMWIYFDPDIYNPPYSADKSKPVSVPVFTDVACTIPALPTSPFVVPTVPAVTPDSQGIYTYYWEIKNVIFQPPPGVGIPFPPTREFTVEAYDRLGNRGSAGRSVQIDDDPPKVDLIEFNYNRPLDPEDGLLYLYGKVAFTVSVTDLNGLYEPVVDGVTMSAIKWWVLPAGDTEPKWNDTPKVYLSISGYSPNTNSWTGGGNFRRDQLKNGRYTGIIDTRWLPEFKSGSPTVREEYKFYIIAMDTAGNTSRINGVLPAELNLYKTFKVDQEKDKPVIDTNSLDPQLGSVANANAVISGTVSDADLFNAGFKDADGNLKKYVQIRFPSGFDASGLPNAWSNDDWIDINVPKTWDNKKGGIDPSGAIVYKFNVSEEKSPGVYVYTGTAANNARIYLTGDGIKYYQIRVTDEPVAPTPAEKDAGAKNYGKNPDEFMTIAPDNVNYPGYQYVAMGSVSKIFPLDDVKLATDPVAYKFIVDASDPEIFFDNFDPTGPIDKHPKYTGDVRPTYSKWEDLRDALSGKVVEYKLSTLSMSWSGKRKSTSKSDTITTIILNNPKDPPTVPPYTADNPYNPTTGEYLWNLGAKVINPTITRPSDITTVDETALKNFFNDMPEGMHILSFEAVDMVGKTSRVTWIFSKDTKGPDINFSSITRAIRREPDGTKYTFLPGIPTSGNSGWSEPPAWPSDWPAYRHDNTKSPAPSWRGWPVTWIQIIQDWPSEYAFLEQVKILAALADENKRNPSTVIGDPEGGANPPVIEGYFSDDYSSVRILVPVANPDPTYFYYRFKNPKDGTAREDIPAGVTTKTEPDGSIWIQKTIEPQANGQNEKMADWKIVLDKASGFTGPDGENWVDIRVQDTAGNWSEIYNVRFVLDRTLPILGKEPNVSGGPTDPAKITDADEFIIDEIAAIGATWKAKQDKDKQLPEMQRVFSAAGAGASNAMAFILKGTVSDSNLSSLQITIGHDLTNTGLSYSVVASVEINLQAVSSPPNNITKADPDKTTRNGLAISPTETEKRLTVTRIADLADGTPQWEWKLSVLEKDIAELRTAAGSNENSARRYIRVIASDKANKRVGPVDWYFYLDKVKPTIEYTNLDKGAEGKCSSFETANFKLSGIVSDDTRIKDVQYMIGRWNYAAAAGTDGWQWYIGGTWTSTPPTKETWPSAFNDTVTAGVVTKYDPARLTSMNWVIDNSTLNASGQFPTDLLKNEGWYRIDLYVTDFSLGDGNPHYTYHAGDYISTDSANSFADKFNTLVPPGDGNMSGRVFYFDKDDPLLEWGWFNIDATGKKIPDPADTTNTSSRTYFKNENGKVNFSFTVGDGNTINEWSANVTYTDAAGTTTHLSSTHTGLIWVTDNTTKAAIIPISKTPGSANVGIDQADIKDQKLIIAPFMTDTGTLPGDALDQLNSNTAIKTYTITIKVKDGAKRESSITKTFNLDNNPPDFIQDKFNPVSYKLDADGSSVAPPEGTAPAQRFYSFDAVTGRLNIRGNTMDNSNQIKRVAFYVAPAGQPATPPSYNASYNFRNPKDIPSDPLLLPAGWDSEEYWHWQDPEHPERYQIEIEIDPAGNKTTLLGIDGTFGWRVMVPNTTIFRTNAVAQKYVQWTKTKKTSPATTPKYRDVTFSGGSTPETNPLVNTDSVPVPDLRFADLGDKIYEDEDVGLITVYVMAEDMAGNIRYDLVKYWIWPEGDRPIVTAINNPDNTKIEAERLLNGTIRISGMAKDNERVKNVWFRVLGPDGITPYLLNIPVWNTTTWEEATPKANQTPKDLEDLGARKSTDSPPPVSNSGGWYMANGGNSPQVSWWAYINTNGELNPTDFEAKKFTVEVRAQDTTYDDKNDQWMPNTYLGMASLPKKVDAWVVAGAPIFEEQRVASAPSIDSGGTPINWDEKDPSAPQYLKYSMDRVSIRNRSSYKVTVKHNSGLSAINWQPTEWNATANAFQAVSGASFNLMTLQPDEYVYLNSAGNGFVSPVTQATAFANLTSGTTSMAVTVKPPETKKGSSVALDTTMKYLIWKWDDKLSSDTTISGGTAGPFPCMVGGKHDPTHLNNNGTHKDMKNTVFTPSGTGPYNLGTAELIESTPETIVNPLPPPAPATITVHYFKWDVIIDVRADLLVGALPASYENISAGRYKNSVHYPVYLSASEVSKATPFTTRGDTLLPIDQLPPAGTYTLNRRPAGSAVSIGGEAGDEGPVNGVARVVLWFQRGTDLISWHETDRTGVTTLPAEGTKNPTYTDGTNPAWWKNANLVDKDNNPVIPATAKKPNIGPETKVSGNWVTNPVGNYAIVIDRNSPSNGQDAWGHNLPMGFADGGMGKYWYVVINSYGITSGPVDLHYVVIDKAGNATYYKEKLIIMNDVAVINKIRLATDIRDNAGFRTGAGAWTAPTSVGLGTTATPSGTETDGRNTILQRIWAGAPNWTAQNYVQRGISDEIYSVALGADKIIDFNVRNNLFALRVETTAGSGSNKARNFRLEYVSGAKRLYDTASAANDRLTAIKAGRVYIIDDPGTARWGAVGAEGDGPWPRGYAFLAAIDGIDGSDPKITGTGSVWELNNAYYTTGTRTLPGNLNLGDVVYTALGPGNSDAKTAEFVYNSTAFGNTVGNNILDTSATNDAYPPAQGTSPVAAGHSMFILRVFDGPDTDMFGTFTIIRVRVNNNDRTQPFAQLYDINPKTEGQDRQNIAENNAGQNVEETRSLSPMFIGEGANSNRTKGGLWNIAPTVGAVTKPGHIEPRKMTGTGYTNDLYAVKQPGEEAPRLHSLSSAEMGGAATKAEATIQKPWADPAGFFGTDTVSGRVVLRGYAEDNEQIDHVELVIGSNTFTILDRQTHSGTPSDSGYGTAGSPADYAPPRTGLLKVASNANTTNNRVHFTDSIDLYRHRVEWAYVWDTETLANTPVVGSAEVRVVSYNRRTTNDANRTSANTAAPGNAHSNSSTITNADYRPNTSPRNPGFPAGLNEYNRITFNLRPYITGFRRNKATFAHDTRSRQGWYMFARNEQIVVAGFNLAGAGQTNITVGGVAKNNIGDATGLASSHAATGDDFTNTRRFRSFTVGDASNGVTGNGVVTLTVNSIQAVNTGNGTNAASSERAITTANASGNNPATARPNYIQPWNKEYSPGKDGSDLWDDFTQAHIWQSNDSTGDNGGRFASTNNWVILSPAMSIDPTNGTLYESHNESGSGPNGNNGTTRMTPITTTSPATPVMQFIDPIFFSDVYRSPGGGGNGGLAADTWVVSSIIGRASADQNWAALGGIYIRGPGGSPQILSNGGSNAGAAPTMPNADQTYNKPFYHGESTWYNASSQANVVGGLPTTDQFMNPHIVTSYTGSGNNTVEHIHVSYYDDKDHSIKYRYNRRGSPGTLPDQNTSAANINSNTAKMWTNLDGGVDAEDTAQTIYTASAVGNGNIAAGDRVVRNGSRGTVINAGKHNSIAVTSQGYPVIAYYDQTNQRLKLAVSKSATPILASQWVIRDYVIPSTNKSSFGTGEFVSMKIDTTNNRVHIAAMNTSKRLVYITGILNPANGTGNTQQDDTTLSNVLTGVTVQVVDHIGNVGRWCSLSLDANGNPWISYMDESYVGARDGAKVAFLNKSTFYKGVNNGTDANSYFRNQYVDLFGASLEGWETMHVPTLHRVENPVEGPGREHGRLGMECWPTRNYTGTAARPNGVPDFWKAAVGYLSQDAEGNGQAMDRYRVAYYVK